MTTLVTGAAGFIGSALVLRLLDEGETVVGVDNHNDYYDQALKEARLDRHANHPRYSHVRADIANTAAIKELFAAHRPRLVIHLAAQAGVRYSLEQPLKYVDSNLVGFANILESCRHIDIEHLVYASSSSVYGGNRKLPFSEVDNVDHPLSIYAATKKANELMAHSYSHLYSLPTTGLRFFTVYGPWDRPDMALQRFAGNILAGEPIDVYNFGNHGRDWTYIDDVIEGIVRVLDNPPKGGGKVTDSSPGSEISTAPWSVYNIGRGEPTGLLDVISALENIFNRKANKNMLPMQPGDVAETHADISALQRVTGYAPTTNITQGLISFANWFAEYYGKN